MEYKPLVLGDLTARIPIVQGGMGVGISLGGLAGAVAKEGGIGIISSAQIGYREPDFEQDPVSCNLRAMEKEYKKAKVAACGGIVGFNIMVALRHYEEYVRKAAATGADLIISGAGLPTELPLYTKGSCTKIAPIVSSDKSAKVILKYWDRKYHCTADMVVIEGPRAGGHLGFSEEKLKEYGVFDAPNGGKEETGKAGTEEDGWTCENRGTEEAKQKCSTADPYDEEILAILETVRHYEEQYDCKIPVVAAGGIDSAKEMKRIMDLGVQGVQVATRFVTTEECDADVRYKMTYVNAGKEDIRIVKSPVGMPGRAIMNPFMQRVMSGEKITPKKCLGCLHKCNPAEIPYCITEALVHAARGEVDQALLFCGANAYKADRIETVKEVIDSLVDFCV